MEELSTFIYIHIIFFSILDQTSILTLHPSIGPCINFLSFFGPVVSRIFKQPGLGGGWFRPSILKYTNDWNSFHIAGGNQDISWNSNQFRINNNNTSRFSYQWKDLHPNALIRPDVAVTSRHTRKLKFGTDTHQTYLTNLA